MEFSRRKLVSMVAIIEFGVNRPGYVYNSAPAREGGQATASLSTICKIPIPTAVTETGCIL